jgi:hypothetical protein
MFLLRPRPRQKIYQSLVMKCPSEGMACGVSGEACLNRTVSAPDVLDGTRFNDVEMCSLNCRARALNDRQATVLND